MVDSVTTRVLRDSLGTPNGAGVTVKNDEWTWGGQARTNEGSLFVQSNYGSSNLKTQIDYKPGSLAGILTGTATTGNLSFIGSVNSSGLMTGGASLKIGGSSTISFNTQAGLSYSNSFAGGWGSFTATLNPSANSWNLTIRDSGMDSWGFSFSSGYSSVGGWSFNTSITSSIFL